MRDDYGLIESGIPPEMVAKLLGNRSRQQIAEAMIAASGDGIKSMGPPGSTVSWTQGLAQLMKAYQGKKGLEEATNSRQSIADEISKGRQAAMEKYQSLVVPASPGVQPLTPNDDEGNAMPSTPATSRDPRKAVEFAMANPYLEKSKLPMMDLADFNRDEDRKAQNEFLAAQKAEQLAARKAELEMRLADAKLAREERAALMKELAEIKKAAGGQGAQPFFQAIPTTNGIMAFNARTGKMELVAGPDGGPLTKTADSPALQGQISGAKEAAQGGAKANQEQFTAAQSAADSLPKMDALITQLKSSDAITGMGAETLKNIERAKALISGSVKAGKKVSDTEILDTMLGSDVFPMIQSLGVGARGMDTPAEREFIRQVMTGTIAMNKDTLIKMAETRKAIAERALNRWNERLNKGELDNWYRDAGRTKQPLGVPSTNVPTATGPNGQKLYLRNGQWVPQ